MSPKFLVRACSAAVLLALVATQGRAAEANAQVDGPLEKPLREEIMAAVGEARRPAKSRREARARAIRAAEDAVALLRSEGYYLARGAPSVSPGSPPRAIVSLVPGPRFVFVAARTQWVGAPPDPRAAAAAISAGVLRSGAPGRAAAVLAAEGRMVSALQRMGYADARALPRRVVVDDQARTVWPTFHIQAGASVRLGKVETSKGQAGLRLAARLAPWRSGDIYQPAKLAELERRLDATGAYSSVSVSLGPPGAAGEPRPVLVGLMERPPHTVELGAGYSSSAGSGIDGKYILYNRLGRADTLAFTGRLYDVQQKADIELDLPAWRRADQILKTGADLLGDNTKAFADAGGGARVNVERRFTQTSYASVGAAFDYAATSEKNAVNLQATPVGERLKLLIPSLTANLVLDRSNDPLDPTRGWRLDATAQPTLLAGDRHLAYVMTQAQASGYLPLGRDAATVLAARLRVGDIWGGRIPDVPADRRFFAGGGGSVRGYAYQGVGPRLSDNTPEGGLSLLETSFEVRQRLNDRFGVVGFVDAGTVGMNPIPTFSGVQAGAGLGVRYNLGFAPLRVDIATPLDPRRGDASVQVYLSIGQSF